MSEAARKLQLADEFDVEGRHEAAFLMRTFRASVRKRDDLLMAFCAENHGASG